LGVNVPTAMFEINKRQTHPQTSKSKDRAQTKPIITSPDGPNVIKLFTVLIYRCS
jgi:hypothetical protein